MDEIQRSLGCIEGQLKGLHAYLASRDERMDAQFEAQSLRLDNHSQRLGGLERKHAWMLGGLAAISAFGTLMLTRVRDLLGGQ